MYNEEIQQQKDAMLTSDEPMPQVGIFWYDPQDKILFGVRKIAITPKQVEEAADKGLPFINYTHFPRQVWANEFFRTQAQNETTKFRGDYTQVPQVRVAWNINSIDANSTDPIPVIYQSGYLTIKGYDLEFKTYTPGFPNEEVEQRFIDFLLPYYANIQSADSALCIQNFVTGARQGDTAGFIKRLKSFFADTPYELIKEVENHYQNVIFILCKLMGFYTKAEYHTSKGCIDIVVKTTKFCYVMGFKLDGTAEGALKQISEKNHTLPFEIEDQQIIRIGMNFSREIRNIEKVLVG